jgi:molybdate transport system substrate-binding protein
VLAAVLLGEADAGVVYVTDVMAADGVSGITLSAAHQVRAIYSAAVVADAADPDLADDFVTLLTSAVGQELLAAHGFGAP